MSGAKRSEFSRGPLGASPSREPCASRARSSGPPFLITFLAEQKSDPAAGTDSRLVSTAVQPHCVTRRGTGSTVVVVLVVCRYAANCKCQKQLLLRSDVLTPDKTTRLHCRHDQAGCSPRQATLFFASPKKRGKKGGPDDRALLAQGSRDGDA